MERTKKPDKPVMTRKAAPIKRTRSRLPSDDRKHIPGFVQGPPDYCEAPSQNRDGIECVDVITCNNWCSKNERNECPAYSKYMIDSELLKQEKI